MTKSFVLLALLLGLFSLSSVMFTKEKGVDQEQKQERPKIEVVFVLDSTGSMSGLIQAAKDKIWSIANTMATAKQQPLIKVGLLTYRDKGDAYITKQTDLTDDLDEIYKDLMSYGAGGGGDTPESVNQALNEAVTRNDWDNNKIPIK